MSNKAASSSVIHMQLLLGLIVVMSIIACSERPAVSAETGTAPTDQSLRSTGEVYWLGARAPLGNFLLVRKGGFRCAIRVDSFGHEGENRTATILRQSGSTKVAVYTSYYRSDGQDDLLKPGYRLYTGKLEDRPAIGVGRLATSSGAVHPECGELRVLWSFPTWIEFYPDADVEIAITRITDPHRLRFSESKIRWFTIDKSQSRNSVVFRRDELCCTD
jgi:hypothetical protein